MDDGSTLQFILNKSPLLYNLLIYFSHRRHPRETNECIFYVVKVVLAENQTNCYTWVYILAVNVIFILIVT